LSTLSTEGIYDVSSQASKAKDLRFATNEERRYALAHLRWLAGGHGRRVSKPSPTHRAYGLSESRGEQIRADIEQMVRDAAKSLAAGNR
jgi:hypothetical protein